MLLAFSISWEAVIGWITVLGTVLGSVARLLQQIRSMRQEAEAEAEKLHGHLAEVQAKAEEVKTEAAAGLAVVAAKTDAVAAETAGTLKELTEVAHETHKAVNSGYSAALQAVLTALESDYVSKKRIYELTGLEKDRTAADEAHGKAQDAARNVADKIRINRDYDAERQERRQEADRDRRKKEHYPPQPD